MDKFLQAMDKYWEVFGDRFPSFELMTLGEERLIEIIEECIAKKKTARELGYVFNDVYY